MATCEQNGHIYGHDAACVFCGEDRPKNQPHGPVSERFMRHHYGASRGAEEFDSHAAIENARRYVRLPTVDADSKRIISALLAALKGVAMTPTLPEALPTREQVDLLFEYVADHAADHEGDCPGDNTCGCLYKVRNDAVNACCRYLMEAQR